MTWVKIFLGSAILMAVLGYGNFVGTLSGIAQLLFFIFIVLSIITLIMHMLGRRKA